MGTCNTPQNEVGGKELLLKVCKEISVATTSTSNDFASAAHGLIVGDVVKFQSVGANTVINTTSFYFVVAVPSSGVFEISATRGGTAIIADATEAALTTDAFQTLGGLRSKSFGFSSEGIDITNQDSDEWKKMLDGAGIRSFSVSGSGVYTNETVFQTAFSRARDNLLTCLMLIDVKASRIYEGCFKMTSLEISGDFDAESNYSISAESSGQITVFNAP